MKIIGLAGSLRKESLNAKLLRAAADVMPAGAALDIWSIAEFPLYNDDLVEEAGLPPAVEALKDAIAKADGLLVATPEYNNSIPGVLKNAFDWLSIPREDIPRVFGGKPVALMGSSMGDFGTVLSQTAWLPILRALMMQPWFGMRSPHVGRGHIVFDETGHIKDAAILGHVMAYIEGFVGFASTLSVARNLPLELSS